MDKPIVQHLDDKHDIAIAISTERIVWMSRERYDKLKRIVVNYWWGQQIIRIKDEEPEDVLFLGGQ